ncbi:hypothetical protein B0T39_06230 [Chromobacterium haemolyticum]|nr:hypothetical protein B0T39_06230 [Chromobacterium haemolyticum]
MSRDVRGCAAASKHIAGDAGGARRKRPFGAAFALSAASALQRLAALLSHGTGRDRGGWFFVGQLDILAINILIAFLF